MFISLEGIEGSGKTSQLKNIVAYLKARGYECVTTREPGGTAIGARIRGILLDPENQELDAAAELLLYVADRVQHVRTFIQPHLAAGRVVLCDRYFDATLAYQGYARGVDVGLIRQLHHLVCGNLQPDVTLLLDLDPSVGLSRAWDQINNGARTQSETRFEQEKLAFHQKVREGYLDIARQEPDRFKVIDAGRDPVTVARALEAVLAPLLPEKTD